MLIENLELKLRRVSITSHVDGFKKLNYININNLNNVKGYIFENLIDLIKKIFKRIFKKTILTKNKDFIYKISESKYESLKDKKTPIRSCFAHKIYFRLV